MLSLRASTETYELSLMFGDFADSLKWETGRQLQFGRAGAILSIASLYGLIEDQFHLRPLKVVVVAVVVVVVGRRDDDDDDKKKIFWSKGHTP